MTSESLVAVETRTNFVSSSGCDDHPAGMGTGVFRTQTGPGTIASRVHRLSDRFPFYVGEFLDFLEGSVRRGTRTFGNKFG